MSRHLHSSFFSYETLNLNFISHHYLDSSEQLRFDKTKTDLDGATLKVSVRFKARANLEFVASTGTMPMWQVL